MAFAAVLTALGYYIILRRFCQGLLKIFLQGAATGEFSLFAACHPRLWRTSPPPPGTAPAGRAGKAGDSSPPGTAAAGASNAGASPRQRAIRPCSGAARRGGRGPLPVRHLFDLPGEDHLKRRSSSPPVPPPWLPALLIGNRFLSVLRQTANFCRRVLIWQIL